MGQNQSSFNPGNNTSSSTAQAQNPFSIPTGNMESRRTMRRICNGRGKERINGNVTMPKRF